MDIPKPEDAYGISKWEAEQELLKISQKTGLEVVIIRSPLVYGKGVKGNLASLIKLIKFGIPLPFSLIRNQRSLVGIDNLIDLIFTCISHPNAHGQTFLVSDDSDLSTPDLIKSISHAMGFHVKLFPFPVQILKQLSIAIGKK